MRLSLILFTSNPQNPADSPLLRLPAEIRNLIYRAALGERLVHLICNHNYRRYPPTQGIWSHVVCERDRIEDGSSPNYLSPDLSLDLSDDTRKSHVAGQRQTHENWSMSLGLLSTCRKVYHEANPILWTTNSFSFDSSFAFKRFMTPQAFLQKELISSLRLEMTWFTMKGMKDWNEVFTLQTARSLKRLRHLRLLIHYRIDGRRYLGVGQMFDQLTHHSFMKGIQKLSTLPLTSVEVAIFSKSFSHDLTRYTLAQKTHLANHIRKLILRLDGAEISAKDQQELREPR